MTAQAPVPDAVWFSKLSKLRDDVLADAHPRIKLPSAAIGQLKALEKSLAENNTNVSTVPSTESLQGNDSSALAASAQIDRSEPQSQPNGLTVPARQPQIFTTPDSSRQSAPQFLPFLLEKSPALVQAEERSKREREEQENQKSSKECKSKRQRLERTLRTEYEKHGGDEKPRNELKNWDGPLTVDVEKLYEEANAVVNASIASPTAARANAPTSSHSSFDENSYYSSQVNERWSTGSEEGEVSEAEPDLVLAALDEGDATTTVGRKARAAHRKLASPAKPPHQASSFADTSGQLGNDRSRGHVGRDRRDESYSPPSPGAFRKDGPNERQQDGIPRGPRAMQRPQQRASGQSRRQDSEEYSPPSPAVPVVRNRINAPVAPQPSRVSPLTNRYASGQQQNWSGAGFNGAQNQDQVNGQKNNKRQQPMQPGKQTAKQQINTNQQRGKKGQDKGRAGQYAPVNGVQQHNNLPRKRGRVDDLDEIPYGRHGAPPAKRRELPARTIPSPLPYIKPEPVSPPALSALPTGNPVRQDPPRRLVLRDDGRSEHDLATPPSSAFARPRTARHAPHPEEMVQATPRVSMRTIGERVPSSPAVVRRPAAESHDLRRVASLQNASHSYHRQPQPAYDPYDAGDARFSRAPSHAPFYQDDVEYIPVPRHRAPVGYGRSMPPGNDYSPDTYSELRAMPPPAKKRIIVLPNGEEYIAFPNTAETRQSLAPEPRRPEYPPQYAESQPSYYRAGSQAVSRPRREVIELDDDEDDYHPRMLPPPPPPPPPMPRSRYMDQSMQQGYSQQMQSRAASVQPYGQQGGDAYAQMPPPPSRGGYGPPHAYLPERAYSVRPNQMQQAAAYERQSQYEMR